MIAACRTCGVKRARFSPVFGDCNGLGTIECLCGGDQCVCHNHGGAECQGCPECDPTTVIPDGDDWPQAKSATAPRAQQKHARSR